MELQARLHLMEHYRMLWLQSLSCRVLGNSDPLLVFWRLQRLRNRFNPRNFRSGYTYWSTTEPSDATAVASRSLGATTPCGCFGGGGRALPQQVYLWGLLGLLQLLEHNQNPQMKLLLRRAPWEQRPLAIALATNGRMMKCGHC